MGLDAYRDKKGKKSNSSEKQDYSSKLSYGSVPIDKDLDDYYDIDVLLDRISDKCDMSIREDAREYIKTSVYDKEQKVDITSDSVSMYISQFFDGEGNVSVAARKDEDMNIGYFISQEIQCTQTFSKRMSGLFDSEGSISVSVQEHNNLANNYAINESIDVSQQFNIIPSLVRYHIFLYEYCDYIGVNHRYKLISDSSNIVYSWRVNSSHDIKKVLEDLKPHLLIKKEESVIYTNYIYPIIEQKRHTSKKGLLEIMMYVDWMDQYKGSGYSKKYDYDYFADKLNWEDDV